MKPKVIKTKCFIKEDNNKYVCKYCNKSYKENVTRMAIHIKKECPNVPKHIMDIFSPKTSEIFAPDEENLTSTSLNFTPMELKQPEQPEPEQHVLLNKSLNVSSKKNMLHFVDTMGKQEKIDLDVLLGRAIFSSTVPFSILENDHRLKFFKALRPSYKSPSRYILSKKLLNNEYEKIKLEVNNLIKNSKIYGIQIDGWSNIRNESIMNVIVTTPKPYVFKTIDCNTERHTGEYIANELSKVIDELDKNKCLGIVTDNATSMKRAWELLQNDDRYKHLPIAFYLCICHTLNLLISDIIKLKSFLDIEQKSKDIVKSIINSHILKGKELNLIINYFYSDK